LRFSALFEVFLRSDGKKTGLPAALARPRYVISTD
jgi:hypothetical protein